MFLYDHLVPGTLGASTGANAWDAVQKKGKEHNYGTSKEDIDAYAAAGGAVVGAAVAGGACTPVAGPVGTYVCGGVGAILGAAVAGAMADAIQSIGAAIFGGSDFQPQPNDVWNPIADRAIAGIVKSLRMQRGLDVSNPTGSFRNYDEWDGVAVVWAQHVNAFVAAQGGPIKWFYDSPSDKDPGRIRQAAIDQWLKCGGFWKAEDPQSWKVFPPPGVPYSYPPDAECKSPDGKPASAPLPQAIVQATEQTMTEVLSGPSTSSPASTVVKVGAVVGAAGVVWYFRKPIFSFLSHILRKG